MEPVGICRHFLVGKCNYADCRFSHDVDGAAEVPQMQTPRPAVKPSMKPAETPRSSSQICRHFLRGTCNVADCRFSHGDDDLDGGLGELGELDAPADAEMEQVNAVNGDKTTQVGGICRHFLQGKCTYGANCRFPHGEDMLPASESTMFEVDSVSGGSTHSGTASSICRHWLEGRCNVAVCRFSHGDADMPRAPTVAPWLAPKPVQRPAPMPVQRPAPVRPVVAPSPLLSGGDNICRHFLQGKCEYGELCRFPHGDSTAMHAPSPVLRPAVPRVGAAVPLVPVANAHSDICRHFLQGRCDRGAECRFSHEALGGLNPAVPMQRPPVVAQFLQQPVAPTVASGANICRHFLEGKCTMGAACRFAHGPVPNARVPVPVRNVQTPPQMLRPVQDERNVCRHFLRNKCEMGDDCAFLHPGAASKPVCAHWLQGKCNYGDACQFRHPKKLQERLASITVHGIPAEVDDAYIAEYFGQFGPVTAVDMKRHADGSVKGMCNVVFEDSESVLLVMADDIAHELNEQEVEVRKVEIPEGQIAALTQDYAARKNTTMLRRSGPY